MISAAKIFTIKENSYTMNMQAFTDILIALLIIAIISVWTVKKSNKRTKALKKFTESLNFFHYDRVHDPVLEDNILEMLNLFILLSGKYLPRVSDVMGGQFNNADVLVADYYFDDRHSEQVINHTIIILYSDDLKLPLFYLQTEKFRLKIGSVFSSQDIDFDSYPVFSNKFLLQGLDDKAIHNFFSNWINKYFEDHLDFVLFMKN